MAEDSAEGTTEAVEPADAMPQDDCPELCPPWVVDAWNLWVGGVKNWSAIARQVGHDRETVKRNVTSYSQTLASLLNGTKVNPLAEYLQGVYQDLGHQTQIATKAVGTAVSKEGDVVEWVDYSVRTRARKEVTECRKLIASAQGVTTERKAVQLTGKDEGPVQVQIVTVDALGEDDWTKTDGN